MTSRKYITYSYTYYLKGGKSYLIITLFYKIYYFFTAKVTFRITLPDGRRQELHGSVDKERSHQNVLLVKTPSLNQLTYQFAHQTVRAEVIVITGRNQMPSNCLPFDFIPNSMFVKKYF